MLAEFYSVYLGRRTFRRTLRFVPRSAVVIRPLRLLMRFLRWRLWGSCVVVPSPRLPQNCFMHRRFIGLKNRENVRDFPPIPHGHPLPHTGRAHAMPSKLCKLCRKGQCPRRRDDSLIRTPHLPLLFSTHQALRNASRPGRSTLVPRVFRPAFASLL
jgi:hypothetical protein